MERYQNEIYPDEYIGQEKRKHSEIRPVLKSESQAKIEESNDNSLKIQLGFEMMSKKCWIEVIFNFNFNVITSILYHSL